MSMTLIRRLALAGSALALGLAFAAAPASAQQQPAPAPTTAVPAQPAPTASHLAVAREVVVATGLAKNFDSLVPNMIDQMRNSIVITRPEIGEELGKTLTALRPEFEQQKEELLAAASRIYASALSEAELKEVAAFFKSATGVRYVNTQIPIVDKLYGEMQGWSRRTSEIIMSRTRAEMKKKNIEM